MGSEEADHERQLIGQDRSETGGVVNGAPFDVFRQEPLPAESPLWNLPNVLITPHSSGTSPGNLYRESQIFVDNLARYTRGDALRNEVGPEGVR